MDLNQFNQAYGTRATEELLDYILIGHNPDWRFYAIKHGIIKQSTKTLRANHYKEIVKNKWINGAYQPIEPYTKYTAYFRNGRGSYVITLHFTEKEISEWKLNQSI